jgi:ATP-binding protein involved in chromosome partitioning
MNQPNEQQILDALKCVVDPDRKRDIVQLGMVQGLRVQDGHVLLTLQVDPQRGPSLEPLRKQVETLVHKLPGVLTANVVLTAERPAPSPQAPRPGQGHQHGHGPGHGRGQAGGGNLLPDVGAVIAVASGKGGVGKSTTAVNLALALAKLGFRTGLLDADIYGPSARRLLGIEGQPTSSDGQRLDPLEKYGIKAMSMAFLVEEETPIVWRGPMVQSALEQMMRDVAWGALDVMVVDMPPGTGDAQLSLVQATQVRGAIIVTTPQDVSTGDALRGAKMFMRVGVPVLGIVENMSWFECPHCGKPTPIFGSGGGQKLADELELPLLGQIPLYPRVLEGGDNGRPIVIEDPESGAAKALDALASKIASTLGVTIGA